jgi:hypothetical protein
VQGERKQDIEPELAQRRRQLTGDVAQSAYLGKGSGLCGENEDFQALNHR